MAQQPDRKRTEVTQKLRAWGVVLAMFAVPGAAILWALSYLP